MLEKAVLFMSKCAKLELVSLQANYTLSRKKPLQNSTLLVSAMRDVLKPTKWKFHCEGQ